MKFYLGTHKASWLEEQVVPLLVSRRTLACRRRLPRARGPWALDSGGFTELSMHGNWQQSPEAYVQEVRRIVDGVGMPDMIAPQDWMCEPEIVRKTGLPVAEHVRRTVENFVALESLAPELPWMPVVQGWTHGDYLDCVEAYARAGVDLAREPVVGIGTVCRRQGTVRAGIIIRDLASEGLRLHAFGFKTRGLEDVAGVLHSADSAAWSLNARKHAPMEGCPHASCANCSRYALAWREGLLGRLGGA